MDEDDLLKFDGVCNDNAPKCQRTKTVEIMLALDPDNAPDEAESLEDGKEIEPGCPPELYLNDFDLSSPTSQRPLVLVPNLGQLKPVNSFPMGELHQLWDEMTSCRKAQSDDVCGLRPTACVPLTRDRKSGSL